jgi:hypothetical protein
LNGQGIGPHNALMLDMFGELAAAAWGATAYQVGSSLTHPNWRDVDVRVLVPTHHFLRLFFDPSDGGRSWKPSGRFSEPMWKAHMLAWSRLGERLTGLPIDFQVEPEEEANTRWGAEPRSALGVR